MLGAHTQGQVTRKHSTPTVTSRQSTGHVGAEGTWLVRLRKQHWYDGQLYLLDLCKRQVPLETEKETGGLKKTVLPLRSDSIRCFNVIPTVLVTNNSDTPVS